jgi:DNA-directed RNA polymerase subunit RPC12/RpoP
MPLKSEPPKKLSPAANTCKVTCLYCSRKYSLDPSKIPPDVSTVKCKACGHSISLKQYHTDTTSPDEATYKITCLYCSKTYTIDRSRIPKDVTTTKCKSCGHAISLAPRHSTILPPKKALETTGTYLNPPKIAKFSPPVTPSPAQPSAPLWRKPWLLAAVLALIVVGVGVIYTGPQFTKFLAGWFGKDQDPNTGIQFHATTLPKPFLNLDVNVPLTLEALERRIPAEKKDSNYTKAVSVINSLDASRIQINLFPNPEHTVLPVAVLHSSKPNRLETKIKKAVAIHTKLEHMPDGSYRLKKEAMPAEMQNDFPIDLYRILFWKKGVVIAPKSFLPELENPEILQQTMVAQMAAAIETPQNLGSLAIRIPENFKAGWEKKIQDLPGLKDNPQITMAAAMGGGILAKMTEPFEKIEALAFGFQLKEDGPRTLSYAQLFRKGVNGAEIYQELNARDQDDFDVDGTVLNLIELFQNPRYQQTIEFKENKLALKFTWSATDDEAFISELSQATIGHLFAQGMQLEPSEGPITTNYTDEPVLTASVNVDRLKQSIPETVKQRIFPGNYWESGDDPQMTLTLDTVDIPNAALAELTYDVLSVKTSGGKDVMRRVEDQFKFKINPGSTTPAQITLNIQKGATALGTAKIRFNLFLPSVLEQIEFKSGEAIGNQKSINGADVKLGRLERDVAKVEYRGARDIRLFAYDKTGRALASQETMSSSSSVSARFQGVIAKIKVVVVKERFDYPFELDVDLNGGKELELSHRPETPKRVRYNSNPAKNYVQYTVEDLEDLGVEWNEGAQMSWNDSLAIQLPKGPFNGLVDWEVHFFGQDKPLYLAGNAFSGTGNTSFSLQKGELQKAHAAFGSVRFNLASDIHRLSFVKKTNGKPLEQRLASGQKTYVTFNQNEITLSAGKFDIIQIMAYDARGRRLEKDNYTRHKDGKLILYFWGMPAKLELDVVSKKIKKTIHFDIRQRPVQEEAYVKFQVDIENQGDVVKTLKAIDSARRKNRTGYGEDVAGLYYVYDRKKKKPMKLIDKKIAHSDPVGQKRFGYTLKSYKGYYFTVLSGTESNGVQKEYPKHSKKKLFAWHKGTFKTIPYIQSPDIVAIPADKSQPTFFLQWDQVYMKQLNGSSLKYLPQDYYSHGWVEAQFIES